MAVTIPIISEFDGKGINKAVAEFKQLEGAGAKASFALKKAAVPAGLAVAGLTAFLVKAAKGAEEARQATQRLDQVLTSMGVPTATKRVSEYAEQLERTIAVDADVIKATQTKLATFSELTKTVEQAGGAFDRATMAALDMAAAGFGTAEPNAIQLGKALQDPIKGITALAKSGVTFTEQEKDKIKVLVESNRMLEAQDMVLKAIEMQVGGTAKASASSFAKMQFALAGIADTFGEMVLPAMDKFAVILQNVADFVQRNQKVVGILTLALGGLAAAIVVLNAAVKAYTVVQMALNIAMTANPIGLVVVAIGALVAAFAVLVAKTGGVKNAFMTMGNFIIGVFERIVNSFNSMINLIIRGVNMLPGVNIPLVPNISLPKFNIPSNGETSSTSTTPGMTGGTSGPDLLERMYGRTPTVPAPTVKLPSIGGGGGGGGGGGAGAGGGGLGGAGIATPAVDAMTGFAGIDFSGMDLSALESSLRGNVNITVNAAVAEATLADKIVDALTDYNRRSGPLDLQIAI